jgi:predicted nuclease of predicted toxin-antitoxin system
MRFFLDANMPRSAVGALTKLGHEVQFARDIGMADAPDAAIAAHARATQAVLVSRDTDFSDVRRYPPEQYSGIAVLRLPDDAIASGIVDVLERFVSNSRFIEHLAGRLAIVESNRVRFRPALE